ncbi:hypothetical protein [Telluribacter humicola]|uniref:hypothetical protein n=1 Tax=Telluribacter humicola TaxID=1720261 RepID=UPI001A97B51C|nr:hypothetical protein [Telluribacter humicola]
MSTPLEITSETLNSILLGNQSVSHGMYKHNIKINTEQSTIRIYSVDFKDDLTISYASSNFRNILFYSVNFKNVQVLDAQLNGARVLNVFECNFKQLTLGDIASLNVKVEELRDIGSILVKGNITKLQIRGGNLSKIDSLIFDCSNNPSWSSRRVTLPVSINRVEHIDVFSVKDMLVQLTFTECYIKHFIYQPLQSDHILINGSVIDEMRVGSLIDNIRVENSTIGSLEMTDVTVPTSNIGPPIKNVIHMNNVKVGNLICNNVILHTLTIDGYSHIGHISLVSGKVDNVSISPIRIGLIALVVDKFKFDKFELKGLSDRQLRVGSLLISDGVLLKGVSVDRAIMELRDFSISNFSIHEFINQSYIYVTNVSVNEWPLRGEESVFDELSWDNRTSLPFINERSKDIFEGVEINCDHQQLLFVNSDLGKINFITSDFSLMSLNIRGSKINEIYLSGSKLPRKVIGDADSRQVGYYQLKKVAENQGDSVQALNYLAKELDAHYDVVSERKKIDRERITLFLNKYSNEFGTNWVKALLWVPLVSVPLYVLYVCSLGYYPTFKMFGKYFENFLKIYPSFFEFLSPVHKVDFLSAHLLGEDYNISANGLAMFIDFIGRLVNGFIIYQFIQAFRKYGKK